MLLTTTTALSAVDRSDRYLRCPGEIRVLYANPSLARFNALLGSLVRRTPAGVQNAYRDDASGDGRESSPEAVRRA